MARGLSLRGDAGRGATRTTERTGPRPDAGRASARDIGAESDRSRSHERQSTVRDAYSSARLKLEKAGEHGRSFLTKAREIGTFIGRNAHWISTPLFIKFMVEKALAASLDRQQKPWLTSLEDIRKEKKNPQGLDDNGLLAATREKLKRVAGIGRRFQSDEN